MTATRVPWQVKYVALSVIWGASFLFIMLGLRALQPIQITAMRVISGTLVLLVLTGATGTRLPRERSTWAHLMVSGFFLAALPFTLFAVAETRVSSALAGIGNATTPLAAMVAGMALLPSDRPTRRKVVGVLLGLVGVVVILQPWRDLGRPDLLGFGMTLVAGASYGLGWVYNRRTLGARDLGGLAQPTAQLVTACSQVILLVLGWWWLNRDRVAAPWSLRPEATQVAVPLLAVALLGMFGTGVAFALQFDVVRAAGPTVGATVTYLIPVVAVLLGVTVLGERLAWPQLVGAAVVISAAVLTQRPSRR
jgi:drug/metabolite transporter (DMT)-like permease